MLTHPKAFAITFPFSFLQLIRRQNSFLRKLPQENFNLKRTLAFPQLLPPVTLHTPKGCHLVHRFSCEYPFLFYSPNNLVLFILTYLVNTPTLFPQRSSKLYIKWCLCFLVYLKKTVLLSPFVPTFNYPFILILRDIK